MQSEVIPIDDRSCAQTISHRKFPILAGSTTSLMALTAYRGATAPQASPESKPAPLGARPEPTAAPAVSLAEPKGKFTEAWNTTIARAGSIPPFTFIAPWEDSQVKDS